jgi:1-acyl-sn-glycerol-3-phosphate acyltransferase
LRGVLSGMMLLRLFRLCFHLAKGLLTCAFLFPWLDTAQRMERVRHWSARLVAICGIRIEVRHVSGAPVLTNALMVSNHISWLDIFVINSVCPSRFVAKADIRGWPMIGWLCQQAGTIFIARGRVREVRRIFERLVASLRAGECVAFFPEGGTAAQGSLLPFHANLFEAAIDAKVAVQPYALRYVNAEGRLEPAVDFVGDTTFMQSVMNIVRARNMVVQLSVLPPLRPNDAHRRELADAAQQEIAVALGYVTRSEVA